MATYAKGLDLQAREEGRLTDHPGFTFRVHGQERNLVRLYDSKRKGAEVGEAARGENGWTGSVRKADGSNEDLVMVGSNNRPAMQEFATIAEAVKEIIARYTMKTERSEHEEKEMLEWIAAQRPADGT